MTNRLLKSPVFKLLCLQILCILTFGCSPRDSGNSLVSVDSIPVKTKMDWDDRHFQWMVAQGYVGELPIVKSYRIDFRKPLAELPFQTVISTDFKNPDRVGMPSDDEYLVLNGFQEQLAKEVRKAKEGVLVYKQSYKGSQMYILYTKSKWENVRQPFFTNLPEGYEFKVQSTRDPEWTELMKVAKRHFPKP